MRPRWISLNEQDRMLYSTTFEFLNSRLEERASVDWALRLKPTDTISRMALLDLIDNPDGLKINEPWRSAWRIIEESWSNPTVENHNSDDVYYIQQRMNTGDRSHTLVKAIVKLVAPKLKVEAFSGVHLRFRKPPTRPKNIKDLFIIQMTSADVIDPHFLELETLTDFSFLTSLAQSLDAAVIDGLDIGRLIGWDGERHLWQLGGLHRVYYVPKAERRDGENEPDEFHQGIAPSVKLLFEVVSRLAAIDNSAGAEFMRRWTLSDAPIHQRLWAALSRDSRGAPAQEVGDFLLSLDDRHFWGLYDFPEIAELRAKRFSDLDPHTQVILTTRIRKCPPRNFWPRTTHADQVAKGRLYYAVRELRRIEIAGALLPKRDKAWLDARIIAFPDLIQTTRLDEGFLNAPVVHEIAQNVDNRYDLLAGEDRLKALENALSSSRAGWDDDPASGALSWIRQLGNPLHVLVDLESIPDGGSAFARVWERFGWAHSSAIEQGEVTVPRNLSEESARVLAILVKLPEVTIRQAIDGISDWLYTWRKQVVIVPEAITFWFKIWPIAVETTNARKFVDEEKDLNTIVQPSNDHASIGIETLNTPAGKLVGVFLAACPNLSEADRPFNAERTLCQMRDLIIADKGHAGVIARYRMVEDLPYFLRADQDWANEYLIKPLTADNSESIALWRAIARRTHFTDVLKIIGGPMSERANDRRLDRETRRSIVFSLIIECLHAFREQREPAVPYTRIQQMIRSLDDEVRAYGAEAIQRFVRDVSAQRKEAPPSPTPEALFQIAAKPFLQTVWPQERSLSTPGVSKALANLPATAQEAFAEAVDTIERFLVPFKCWSMIDYGLYGEEDQKPKLTRIDNHAKAEAFLRLLDHTIGTAEGSVIPHDLASALDQIIRVVPNLAENRTFRRLATAARRR